MNRADQLRHQIAGVRLADAFLHDARRQVLELRNLSPETRRWADIVIGLAMVDLVKLEANLAIELDRHGLEANMIIIDDPESEDVAIEPAPWSARFRAWLHRQFTRAHALLSG